MEKWLVHALLAALFAGLVGVFGKVGVQGVNSNLATTARAVIMALGLIILISVRRETAGFAHITPRT